MRKATATNNKTGQKKGDMKHNVFYNRFPNNEPYYSVKTGILDALGDEIILTVLPERNIVTDEGYTEFLLNSEQRPKYIKDAKTLIEMHGIEITDSYNQELSLKYKDTDWEPAVKRLVACVVDVYAVIIR